MRHEITKQTQNIPGPFSNKRSTPKKLNFRTLPSKNPENTF